MPCVPFDYGTLWAPDYSMASGNAVPTAVGSKKKKKAACNQPRQTIDDGQQHNGYALQRPRQ